MSPAHQTIPAQANAANIPSSSMLRRWVFNARSIKERGKTSPAALIPANWQAAISVPRMSRPHVERGKRSHITARPLPKCKQRDTAAGITPTGQLGFTL
jgi:hypothetical protein